MRYEELTIEGRNAVLEAFRSGKTIDKLFVLDGCRMVRCVPLSEKLKNTIPLSIMLQKSAWTRCLRQENTRVSSPMRLLMNTQR